MNARASLTLSLKQGLNKFRYLILVRSIPAPKQRCQAKHPSLTDFFKQIQAPLVEDHHNYGLVSYSFCLMTIVLCINIAKHRMMVAAMISLYEVNAVLHYWWHSSSPSFSTLSGEAAVGCSSDRGRGRGPQRRHQKWARLVSTGAVSPHVLQLRNTDSRTIAQSLPVAWYRVRRSTRSNPRQKSITSSEWADACIKIVIHTT